jgi:hypothetical protein
MHWEGILVRKTVQELSDKKMSMADDEDDDILQEDTRLHCEIINKSVRGQSAAVVVVSYHHRRHPLTLTNQRGFFFSHGYTILHPGDTHTSIQDITAFAYILFNI